MADATVTEEKKQYPEKVQQAFELITGFTMLENVELLDMFESELGITPAAAAPVAMMAAGPAEVEEAAEPSWFKVVLKGFGDKKIQVIKAVRSETALALKEAKAIVEAAPSTIKEGLAKEDAEKCVQTLVDAGGEAEVQPE